MENSELPEMDSNPNLPDRGLIHIKPSDMFVFVTIPGESFTFDGQSEIDPPMSSRDRAIIRAMLLDALNTLDRSLSPVPIPALPQITYPSAY